MAKKSFVDKEIKSSSYGKSGITFENLDSQVALTENTILVGVDNAGELVPAIKEADVAKKADIDQVVVQNVEVGVDGTSTRQTVTKVNIKTKSTTQTVTTLPLVVPSTNGSGGNDGLMPKESAETLGKNTTNISQLLIDTASLDERLTEVEEETSSIENSLAPVATSGSYNDLTDKPDIPPNHNRGTFTTLASVPLPNNASRNPPIVNGDYVIVGTSGVPATMYIADITDNTWEAGGSVNDPAVIKTLYESNADTNAFTDHEKSKLSGIQSGAEINVKSNWIEEDDTSDAYIQNKPTIRQPVGATNSSLGLVKGSTTNGKGYVESDFTISLNGYDDIIDRIETLESEESGTSGDLSGHVGNTNNPHSVTKSQVGLGSVDNTSDADKPLSTAATTALGLKVDKLASKPTAGTYTKVTINGEDQVTSGTSLSDTDLPNITLTDENGSTTLPATASGTIKSKIQALRNNVKYLLDAEIDIPMYKSATITSDNSGTFTLPSDYYNNGDAGADFLLGLVAILYNDGVDDFVGLSFSIHLSLYGLVKKTYTDYNKATDFIKVDFINTSAQQFRIDTLPNTSLTVYYFYEAFIPGLAKYGYTGINATAVGISSTASGNSSTAIGISSTASGNSSTAVGERALSSAISSIAVGNSSNSFGISSVSVGNQSESVGDESIAIGKLSKTKGFANIAIGSGASAEEQETAIAIGYNATSEDIGIAIGTDSKVLNGVAIGQESVASGNETTALGMNANATGEYGVALGTSTAVSHYNAVALGTSSETDRDNSVSVGNSSNKRVITNVATPTTESDAATKEYADNLVDKDIKYSDFQRVTKSGTTITFNNKEFNCQLSPTANFSINAGSGLIPGGVYVLKVTVGTVYTMTLGTGVTNMGDVDLTLTANKQTIFVLQATNATSLQLLSSITQG